MATAAQRSASRARRGRRLDQRVQWFGEEVARGVEVGMEGRLRFAAQYLRDKIVFNLSYPVGRANGRVTQRSRSGEFPRADTTRLMKDIFFNRVNDLTYRIGTTLDYGLWLETRMNRSFLVRTLREERQNIRSILVAGRNVPGDHPTFRDEPPGAV